jgi:hypothetical protein
MVCLIVPSTESRILTPFGMIELWNKDVEQYTIDVFVQDQQNQTNYQLPTITLPRLLITDHRYCGMEATRLMVADSG